MIVLGIETATVICSVGIAKDDQAIGEIRLAVKNIHAEVLTDSIRSLLSWLRLSFSDVDGIAVSIGPGSFTGLRIGVATAKGLAFSLGKPIVGIDTLYAQAMAATMVQKGDFVVPVIRSRQNELYAARYRRDGVELVCAHPAAVFSIAAFASWLTTPALICGNAVPMIVNAGVLDDKKEIDCMTASTCQLSGARIAELGLQRLKRGDADDLANLEPAYVQEFQLGR